MLASIVIRPSDELLKQAAPLQHWNEAVKQAKRSCHKRHRTGAVIFRGSWVYGTGCSHKHDGSLKVNSVHAEQHAISVNKTVLGQAFDAYCLIVTLTRVDNFANCSRPCADCARALQKYGVGVIYAERTNDGGWAIREVPFDLLTEGYLKATRYSA